MRGQASRSLKQQPSSRTGLSLGPQSRPLCLQEADIPVCVAAQGIRKALPWQQPSQHQGASCGAFTPLMGRVPGPRSVVMQPAQPVPGARGRNEAPGHRKGPAGATSAIRPDLGPPSAAALILLFSEWRLLQLETQERGPGCQSLEVQSAPEQQQLDCPLSMDSQGKGGRGRT